MREKYGSIFNIHAFHCDIKLYIYKIQNKFIFYSMVLLTTYFINYEKY